jgi:hypothetical protein
VPPLSPTGRVTDLTVLVAALLHDTPEDTETRFEELHEHFAPEPPLTQWCSNASPGMRRPSSTSEGGVPETAAPALNCTLGSVF